MASGLAEAIRIYEEEKGISLIIYRMDAGFRVGPEVKCAVLLTVPSPVEGISVFWDLGIIRQKKASDK